MNLLFLVSYSKKLLATCNLFFTSYFSQKFIIWIIHPCLECKVINLTPSIILLTPKSLNQAGLATINIIEHSIDFFL